MKTIKISHTRLTDNYSLDKINKPNCTTCNKTLSIPYKYSTNALYMIKVSSEPGISSVISHKDISNIIEFLKERNGSLPQSITSLMSLITQRLMLHESNPSRRRRRTKR